jgi:ribosomal protein S18 acetylase RimI-like enzyme
MIVDVFTVEMLEEDAWPRLREARLAALREAPDSFMSNYALELSYQEAQWRAEFARGEWALMTRNGQTVGLLGATREPKTPRSECYLEYLWVLPELRRSGVASSLVRSIISYLTDSGVSTIWLWVLEGNDAARQLYERLGFVDAGRKQPLRDRPERNEELMKLTVSTKSAGAAEGRLHRVRLAAYRECPL